MPRRKGSGAINHIDVAKHGDVEMRGMLWRNDKAPAENEAKLEGLITKSAKLTVELSKLRTLEEDLSVAVSVEGNVTLARAKSERQLRKVSADIRRLENELGETAKEIEVTRDEITFGSPPAVLDWQERAVFLMTAHKLLDKRAGDNTASPGGSTITPRELLNQLRAEGFFENGARDEQSLLRELRRFMRQCGVAGQQGRRTDLRAT